LAAVLYLSQKDENRCYCLDEISRATGIAEEFLRKIFQVLVKSGIVNSFKGRGGAVSLARSPEDITVFQVIEPLEGKKGLVRCLRGEYCPRSNECVASRFWQRIQEQLFETLDRIKIKDLIEMGKEKSAKKIRP